MHSDLIRVSLGTTARIATDYPADASLANRSDCGHAVEKSHTIALILGRIPAHRPAASHRGYYEYVDDQ